MEDTIKVSQLKLTDLLSKDDLDISGEALNTSESARLLKQLNSNWDLNRQETPPVLTRSFKLKNYAETVHLATQISMIAVKYNHHPEIRYSWNKCSVIYTTYSCDDISLKDFVCALAIDSIELVKRL